MALEDVRAARIQLAWLFEPANPDLTDLVTVLGPQQTVTLLAEQPLPRTALRPELRSCTPDRLWAAAQRVAARTSQVLIPEDPGWPTGLPAADAPLCLWTRGPAIPDPATSVAIVGSRAATDYGRHAATDLAQQLAGQQHTIVADGGFGVATAALRSALLTSCPPIAILPTGLDRPHPAVNHDLFATIADTGLLLSPFPPGAQATRSRILYTQRLLAALTAGTVLIEAALRSPILEAIRHAAHLGRAALIVPGPITSAHSAGGHDLLRRDPRTRPVTSATDILTDLHT